MYYDSDRHLRSWLRQMGAVVAKARARLLAASPPIFVRLRSHGASFSPIGFDVTPITRRLASPSREQQHPEEEPPSRPDASGATAHATADGRLDASLDGMAAMVEQAVEHLLVEPSRASDQHEPLPKLLWRLDQRPRSSARLPEDSPAAPESAAGAGREGTREGGGAAHTLLQQLAADGVARVDGWAKFGLDVAALRAEALAALDGPGARFKPSRLYHGDPPLPSLAPLLHSRPLARALSAYLGGAARYDGATVVTSIGGTLHPSFLAREWHHDRAGRRLKLFVFVSDVCGRATRTLR